MDVTARTIDQAIEVGNHIYHQHRLTDRGEGRFWMRQRAHQVGPAIIGTLQYSGPGADRRRRVHRFLSGERAPVR